MTIRAAGILIVDPDGNALLLKRGPGGDAPGLWCFPGGRLEDGETPLQAAIRETQEEAGFLAKEKDLLEWVRSIGPRVTVGVVPTAANPGTFSEVVEADANLIAGQTEDVDFTAYLLRVKEQFIPELGPEGAPEHTAWAWASVKTPPEPMHPGAALALRRFYMTERELAEAMAVGSLTSPQDLGSGAGALFAIRITGTGQSFRSKYNENVLRPAKWYLNDEFLNRCAGLPVILEHPAGRTLNSKEYKSRNIGSVMLAYIVDDEVWAIARVIDAGAVALMKRDVVSTSPTVVWRDPEKDNASFQLSDGETLLIEGKPALLDHVAIVERGVWDKDGPPTGVDSTDASTREDAEMKVNIKRLKDETDEAYAARIAEAEAIVSAARADAEGEAAKLKQQVDSLDVVIKDATARMDKMEKARADAEEDDEKEKKADARKRADAFKFSKRGDGEDDEKYKARHDAEEKACADAEEEAGEVKETAADKAKKRRADAEEEEMESMADKKKRSDAEKEKERADAATVALKSLEDKVAEMKAQLDARAQRTDEEHDKFLAAQARADEAYQPWGRTAPRPMDGESLLSFRRRLLEGVQQHTEYKEVNLRAIAADVAAFGVIEGKIIAEAAKMGRSPASVPDGELREVVRQSGSGHKITEFVGDPRAWMNVHSPVGQAVQTLGVKH